MVAYDLAMVEARVRFPYPALCSDGRVGPIPTRKFGASRIPKGIFARNQSGINSRRTERA